MSRAYKRAHSARRLVDFLRSAAVKHELMGNLVGAKDLRREADRVERLAVRSKRIPARAVSRSAAERAP